MSIYESAQQLGALTDQIPAGLATEIETHLEGLQGQVAGLLGDTSSATEIQGQIGAAITTAQQLSAALQQLGQTISDAAAHHQQ